MRYILFFWFITLFGCVKQSIEKKQTPLISNDFLTNVKKSLENNLSRADYADIDFGQGTIKNGSGDKMLRLAFLDKDMQTDFILLVTDSLGNCSQGRIVHLQKFESKPNVFNGKLTVQTLSRSATFDSQITNGFVEMLHPKLFSVIDKMDVLPDPSETLPEVVVVGYLNTSGGLSFSDYMYFESMLAIGGGGGGGMNTTIGGSSSLYSPLTSGGSGSGIVGAPSISVNYETSFSKPGIDLAAYLKCFSTIIDQDSQCSVTIYTDLPVNNDPTKFFDWFTGATGHSFLQLTKTRGAQSVTQYIGFTPAKPLQALTGSNPVASKVVDNAGHKYNASLTVNISPEQLKIAISTILDLSELPYSIIHNNCVDFALGVINSVRGLNPLIVPKYPIPGQTFSNSNTPEGLFKLLASMKQSTNPESKNILTNVVLHAGVSHGACN